MLRKTILALTAAAALGGVALAPTSASAWGFHGGFHGGWHGGFFGPAIVIGAPVYDSCLVRTWVPGSNGPVLRTVDRCY